MSDPNSAGHAEPASTSHPTRPGAARYRVFLSYSHADTKWARWLMRRLELYRVPRRFHGRTAPIGEVGWRIAPVFRDRDELPTTSDLGETIRAALRESATLVVICSPSSAKSRWVQEEILAFKRLHGERRVFAFIVSGEPKVAGAGDDCFSPALRVEIGADGQMSARPAEVVAADARVDGDGPKLAFIRLVAGLLGVGFDELRQRELQRRNRRLMVITGCSLAGMALTFGLAVVAWQARNDAQRRQDQAEDVFAFMLGDFRPELKKVGRLDLLDKVGDKAMAYFDALDARDVTDTTLARQAKALTQIGEIRMEQKDARYADAGRAFFTAYQRAASLTARHPKNGDMLFERAQAEFWIGHVHYRRGDFAPAAEWLGRYRDSAVALVALDPSKQEWQRELKSGWHNLAVLEAERGNLAAAREDFLAVMESARRLSAADPKNTQLLFQITDVDSYLGSIAERAGDLAEAMKRFAAQRAGLEALIEKEPATVEWAFRLADCLSWNAETLAICAQLDAARECVTRGKSLLGPLLARDPSNRRWQGLLALMRLCEATIEATADPARAMAVLAEARATLELMIAAEPTDRVTVVRLMKAWRLTTRAALESDPSAAPEAATRAMAMVDTLVRNARLNDRILGEIAQCHIVAARAAANRGQGEAARNLLTRAADLLGPKVADSKDWRLIDPATRIFTMLGRADESRALSLQLRRIGYTPLEPWPSPLSSETKTIDHK